MPGQTLKYLIKSYATINLFSYKLENNSAFIYNEETDGLELSTTGSYTTTTKDNNKIGAITLPSI